jgi:hypothetical protein
MQLQACTAQSAQAAKAAQAAQERPAETSKPAQAAQLTPMPGPLPGLEQPEGTERPVQPQACSERCAAHSAAAHRDPDSSQMKRKDRKHKQKSGKRAAKGTKKPSAVKHNLGPSLEEKSRSRGMPEYLVSYLAGCRL